MLCIGHRGARGHAPENTLASIRKALALGARAVEVDVHCCDGELVVIHDDTVERTTNGHGTVQSFALNALRALDAGNGERIPLLQEVMDAIEGKAAINIELKGAGTAQATAQLIAHYRQRGWPAASIQVSSFDWSLLTTFREHDEQCPIGLLAEKPVFDALGHATDALRSRSWNVHHAHIDQRLMQQAQQHRQRVYAYTVNHASDMQRLQRLGVNGIFTDYPERALTYQTAGDGCFD
ncbi:MAG TPA: glycerophosphodiester phosphodiesterase [Pseudomonadales bacterium]|jgi:glycerophosphoryl diester phosphodiesterase